MWCALDGSCLLPEDDFQTVWCVVEALASSLPVQLVGLDFVGWMSVVVVVDVKRPMMLVLFSKHDATNRELLQRSSLPQSKR